MLAFKKTIPGVSTEDIKAAWDLTATKEKRVEIKSISLSADHRRFGRVGLT